MNEPLSLERQHALLQYWEASKALRSALTDAGVAKAIALMNQAETALWMLEQPADSLRTRVEIANKDQQ